jgi:hypothetical protein
LASFANNSSQDNQNTIKKAQESLEIYDVDQNGVKKGNLFQRQSTSKEALDSF